MTRVTRFVLNLVKRINKPKTLLAILLVVLAVSGSLYMYYVWNSSINETSKQALKIATTAGSSLNGEMLKKLNALPEDLGTEAYESIKKRLMEIVSINSEIRFAYFYTQKAGKIYIMADSEPVDSEDYVPPGLEYTEADKLFYKPFEDEKALITEPITNRWGTWVSVLVPMKNLQTGKIIAVFGMDYPAKMWSSNALTHTFQAGIVVIAILLLILAFYKLLNINKVLIEGHHKLNLANDEIINAQKKYTDMFEKNQSIMLLIESDTGKVTNANNAACEFYGYTINEIKNLKITDIDISTGEETFSKMALVKKQEENHFDLQHRLSSGEIRDVEVFSSILETNGKMDLYSIIHDITDRKRTEEALRESEETLQAHIKNSFDVIFTLNKDGVFDFVSTAWERHFGYPVSEVIGKSFALFIHPDDVAPCIEYLMRILSTGQSATSPAYRVKHANGSWRLFTANGTSYVNTKSELQFIGIGRDITELKRAEDALKESEEKHRSLIENSHDIIYTLTADGIFTFVSPAWTALLGHPITQVEGQPFRQFVHPDDLTGCMVWLQKVIETEQRQEGVEYRVRHTDGSWRWHTSSAVPIRDEAGMIMVRVPPEISLSVSEWMQR